MTNNPLSQHFPTADPAITCSRVEWITSLDKPRSAEAGTALLDAELYLAHAIREGARYPRMRNYHGRYYFSGVGKFVWHESLLERNMLMCLDFLGEHVAMAAQPMKLTFSDNTHHVPDFASLDVNGEQTIFDVKPASRLTPKYVAQFAKTAAFCQQAGFNYQVLTGSPAQQLENVRFLHAYRGIRYRPTVKSREHLEHAGRSLTVNDASLLLAPGNPRLGHTHVFHLLWHQELAIDLTAPLTTIQTVRIK